MAGAGWRAGGLGILLFAFLVRVLSLDHQSLWYDEAFTLTLAQRDLPALVAGVAHDNHPPLHFLVLHFWLQLAGTSEFALRFLSTITSVLTVALTLALGRRLLDVPSALAAALLVAVAPLQVWYGQETRMYSLAGLAVLVATYAGVRALGSPRPPGWALAGALATLAALYAHLYTAFPLAALDLSLIAWWAWRAPRERGREPHAWQRWRGPFTWGGGQIAAAVGFLPWLPYLQQRYDDDATYWPGGLDVERAISWLGTAYGGTDLLPDRVGPLAWPTVLLAVLGLLLLLRRRPGAALLLGLGVALPLALLLAVSLDRPKFAPRYLLFSHPFFLLLAAAGPGALLGARPRWRALGALALAPVLAVSGWGLAANAFDPAVARTDFRAAAAYLREHWQEGDAVAVNGGHAQVVVRYYLPDVPLIPFPDVEMAEIGPGLDPEAVAERLNQVAEEHPRLWLLLWQNELQDPNSVVERMLREQARERTVDATFRRVKLRRYALRPRPFFSGEPQPQHLVGASFAGQIELVGYDIEEGPYEPGERLDLKLYWRALRPLEVDYTVFTHLLDPRERVVAQHDKQPLNRYYRTSRWPPGRVLRDEYRLPLPPALAPGRYPLEVGIYLAPAMTRLEVAGRPGETRVVITEVEITAPS